MIKEYIIKNKKILTKNIDDCFRKSSSITKYLTNVIINSAFKHKLKIKKEVKLNNFRGTKRNWRGTIDIRVFEKKNIFDIEIDRGNKLWSLEKLHHCRNMLNHEVLWIKWGLPINEKAMEKIKKYNIDFLFLPTEAHRKHKKKMEKLSLGSKYRHD